MTIELEKLIIERIVLEVRFSRGFLYWDNCGKIWKALCDKWADLEMVTVDPAKALFKINDEGLELKFSQADIHLSQSYPPSSLNIFKEVGRESIPLIANFLETKTFSRIGNRIFYLYPTASLEEASDIVRKTGLLSISEEKIKLFGDTLEEPCIQFRIQDEDVGYRFNVQALSRKLELQLPKPIEVDSSKFVKHAVLVDVDYFTRKSVDLSITDFEEIINQVQKSLRYSLGKLFS